MSGAASLRHSKRLRQKRDNVHVYSDNKTDALQPLCVVRFIDTFIGYGVFAKTNISKGTQILFYKGEVTEVPCVASDRQAQDSKDNGFQFYYRHNQKTFCVDATNSTSIGRMVNDEVSSKANCKMTKIVENSEPKLCLIAKRNISEGEELRYDYGVCNLPWRKLKKGAVKPMLYEEPSSVPNTPQDDAQPNTPQDQPNTPQDDAQPNTPQDDAQPNTQQDDAQSNTQDDAQPNTPQDDAQPNTPQDDAQSNTQDDVQPNTPQDDAQPNTPQDDAQPYRPQDDAQLNTPQDDAQPNTPQDQSNTPQDDAQPNTPQDDAQPCRPQDDAQLNTPQDDAQPNTPQDDAQPNTPQDDAQSNTQDDVQPNTPQDDAQPNTPQDDAQLNTPQDDALPNTPQDQSNTPQDDAQPNTPQDDTQPYRPQDDVQLNTPQDDAQPNTPQDDAQPNTPQDDAQPNTPQDDAQPNTPQDDAQPNSPQDDAQPNTPQDDAQLNTPQDDAQPNTQQDDAQPNTPQDDTQPMPDAAATDQSDGENVIPQSGNTDPMGQPGAAMSSSHVIPSMELVDRSSSTPSLSPAIHRETNLHLPEAVSSAVPPHSTSHSRDRSLGPVGTRNNSKSSKPSHNSRNMGSNTSMLPHSSHSSGNIGDIGTVTGVVTSGLSKSQKLEVRNFCLKNDMKLSECFNPKVTHVVIGTDPIGSCICHRTMKYMKGVAHHCWIIDYQWIIESQKAGYFIPEDGYEVIGNLTIDVTHYGPQKSRLNKTSLLQGYSIYLEVLNEEVTRDDLEDLVTCSGGSLLNSDNDSMETTKCKKLAVACMDEHLPSYKKTEVISTCLKMGLLVVSHEWLFDSITVYEVQDYDEYLIIDDQERLDGEIYDGDDESNNSDKDPEYQPSSSEENKQDTDGEEIFLERKALFVSEEQKRKFDIEIDIGEIHDGEDESNNSDKDPEYQPSSSEENKQDTDGDEIFLERKSLFVSLEERKRKLDSNTDFMKNCVQNDGKRKKKTVDIVLDSDSDTVSDEYPMLNVSPEKKKQKLLIDVQKANNDGKRRWDKLHYCMFCGQASTNIRKHYFSKKHQSESHVQRILSFPLHSKERSLALQQLRNAGDYKHNYEVMKNGEGTLVPWRNVTEVKAGSEFLPCEHCLAFFTKKDLWRHHKVCKFNKHEQKKYRKVSGKAADLLPCATTVSNGFKSNILERMSGDEISLVARNDCTIIKLGEKLYQKHVHLEHMYNYIGQKMREMARLLISIRKEDCGVTTVEDLIDPTKCPLTLSCARKLCGYDETTNSYKNPSLALKLGYTLKKCAMIKKSIALIEENEEKQKKAENFVSVHEFMWPNDISSVALKTLQTRKWNKPSPLPLTEDVSKVQTVVSRSSSKARSTGSKKGKVQRLTHEQNITLRNIFQSNVDLRKELKRMECEKCIATNTCLRNLSWKKVKNTVHNWITAVKRRAK